MSFPLQEKPEWSIIDSSKLTNFLECPRKYFYEHILGWRVDAPKHDAYFGESWHKAREYQLLNGYEDVKGAYDAFIEYYRKEFDEDTDELYRPKDPTAALHGLMRLAEERSNDLEENEVVTIDGKKMTEISGTVPISDNKVIHYRMDSIMRRKEDGKIFSWDHKTTKRFSRQWRENFHLSIQNGTYTHCLYCMFPIEEVLGVEFYGAAFEYLKRGSKNREAGYHVSFELVPAFKTPDQMNVWLYTVLKIYNDIEDEMNELLSSSDSDDVLTAFPLNPTNCTKYFGCAYHDFCLSWTNPLQHCDEVPLGFKTEFWNPSEMDTTNKKDLELPGR